MTWLWTLAVLTVVVVVACDRVPLTSPTGSTISLTIDRSILPVNGQATITAVVTEVSGTPVHNGTTVTFQSSLGRTDPIEAQTVNGKAVVTFLAGTISGTGTIHAFSGGARTGSGNSSAGGVEVKIGTAGADRVGVRTEPINVPISGGTVVVVASLFDAGGNPIINTPVAISSDFGALSSNSATTDANGEARVSLTTNRTTAITVTAGAKTGTFTLTALAPPAVTLACGAAGNTAATVGLPISCTIGVTSGNTTSSTPVQNLTVNWGDGSGEQPLGVNASTVVSHIYTSPGSFVVTAAATDANSQRGTAVLTLNVTRTLPTITVACPTSTQTVGTPGAFTVTPATTQAIPLQNVTVDLGDGTSRNLGQITGPTSFTKAYGAEGGYTVTATVTDTSGQRGTSSCGVIVARGTGPTITSFTQTSNTTPPAVNGGPPESFSIVVAAGTSGAITSVIVTRQDGFVLHTGTGSGSFATSQVAANDILTLRVTDSAGNVASTQLVVQ